MSERYSKCDEVTIEFKATIQHDSKAFIFVNQEGEINTLEIGKKNAKITLIGEEDD